MNTRLARKRALLQTGRFPRPLLALDLFERTGSIAMAVGFWKPRVLIDPRTYGEHRAIREYVLHHEAWHVLANHTRILAVARWLGIAFFAALGAIAVVWTRSPWVMGAAGFVAARLEASLGLFTMALRARFETDADAAALAVMQTRTFAAAVKTMAGIRKPTRGVRRWVEDAVYGADYRERLRRVGVVEAA